MRGPKIHRRKITNCQDTLKGSVNYYLLIKRRSVAGRNFCSRDWGRRNNSQRFKKVQMVILVEDEATLQENVI